MIWVKYIFQICSCLLILFSNNNLGHIFHYYVPVVTHVFKSEDINIVLTKDMLIVHIVGWYKHQVESVV
jgi:hypothetical protein